MLRWALVAVLLVGGCATERGGAGGEGGDASSGGDTASPGDEAHGGDVAGGDVAGGDSSEERTLVIGTGSEAFVPISDDDTLVLVMGPQGGYHAWGGARVHGAALTASSRLRYTLTSGGTQIAITELIIDPATATPDLEQYGVFVLFDWAYSGFQFDGATATFRVELALDGVAWSMSDHVTVVLDCCDVMTDLGASCVPEEACATPPCASYTFACRQVCLDEGGGDGYCSQYCDLDPPPNGTCPDGHTCTPITAGGAAGGSYCRRTP